MNNARLVRNTLAALDGERYNSKEDVENAVYPVFGPLTSIFQGEGHRDLVDRLIGAKWITVVDGKWTVKLPAFEPEKAPEVETPIGTSFDTTQSLSLVRFMSADKRPCIGVKFGDKLVGQIDQQYIKETLDMLGSFYYTK